MNTETANIETGDQLTDLIGKARLVKAPAKRKRSRSRKASKAQPKAAEQQAQPQQQQATTARGSVPADAITDDAVITVLVEANPKKNNSWAYLMFAELMMANGKTVADYRNRLAQVPNLPKGYRARGELQLALRREWVRLDKPKAESKNT